MTAKKEKREFKAPLSDEQLESMCGSLRKIAGHLTAATDELWVLIHNLEGKDDAVDADTGVSK